MLKTDLKANDVCSFSHATSRGTSSLDFHTRYRSAYSTITIHPHTELEVVFAPCYWRCPLSVLLYVISIINPCFSTALKGATKRHLQLKTFFSLHSTSLFHLQYKGQVENHSVHSRQEPPPPTHTHTFTDVTIHLQWSEGNNQPVKKWSPAVEHEDSLSCYQETLSGPYPVPC
jgi:hypothetical protein